MVSAHQPTDLKEASPLGLDAPSEDRSRANASMTPNSGPGEPSMIKGAVLGILIGGVIGALLGALEGSIVSGLGVPVGILSGFILGAVPGGTVGALITVSVHRDLTRALPRLTEEEAVGASARLTRLKAAPGEVIVRQGDLADRFYIVSKGEVEVIRDDPAGESRRLAILGPGEFFGEIGLLREVRRTATVRASKPTELLALDGASFSRFLASSGGGRADLERAAGERAGNLGEVNSTKPVS